MSRFFLVFALLFMIAVPPAFAQEAASERLAVAKQIVKLTRVTETMENIMPSIMQQQMQALPGRENLSEEQQKAIDAAVQEFAAEFAASFEPMFDQVAALYAQKFSLEELEGVRDFYQSDVGQSFVAGSMELAPQMAQFGQTWVQQNIMPAAQKFGARLQAIKAGQ